MLNGMVIVIKLSKTSKMPCESWSTEAVTTCPGAVGAEVCEECYANRNFYLMPNSVALRQFNRHGWKRNDWTRDMVDAIGDSSFFRWFDSGDIYTVGLAKKLLDVIKRTPNTSHWIPTRSYRIPKLKPHITALKRQPNCAVRYSSSRFDSFNKRTHGSVVYKREQPAGTFQCTSYERSGECGSCRACWDKSVRTVAYKIL